ncbi:hypothetical protein V8C35DRAFT_130801 [Trichoderma chlorosporum]
MHGVGGSATPAPVSSGPSSCCTCEYLAVASHGPQNSVFLGDTYLAVQNLVPCKGNIRRVLSPWADTKASTLLALCLLPRPSIPYSPVSTAQYRNGPRRGGVERRPLTKAAEHQPLPFGELSTKTLKPRRQMGPQLARIRQSFLYVSLLCDSYPKGVSISSLLCSLAFLEDVCLAPVLIQVGLIAQPQSKQSRYKRLLSKWILAQPLERRHLTGPYQSLSVQSVTLLLPRTGVRKALHFWQWVSLQPILP